MVKSPDVLGKANPGDEIDFVTENTDKGMVVTSVTVTKAGSGTPIPTAGDPGTTAPVLPSGAPAPAGPSGVPKGAPAPAGPSGAPKGAPAPATSPAPHGK